MKKSIAILIAILVLCAPNCFAQGKITRTTKQKTETQQTNAKRQQEAEAKRKQEAEEAKRKQEEEAKRKQKEEAKRKQEEEAESLKETGKINGHGYVDLGLPSGLKWATCNVGSTTPEGYGYYFAWGETKTKSSYGGNNSITYNKSISTLKSDGIINSSGNLNGNYDAARANWGSTWRMPTKAELDELVKNCTWMWATQDGKNGYKVTGKNGKSIFLPAAGERIGTSLNRSGENGSYWSSSVFDGDQRAYDFIIIESSQFMGQCYRIVGQTIRPVSE